MVKISKYIGILYISYLFVTHQIQQKQKYYYHCNKVKDNETSVFENIPPKVLFELLEKLDLIGEGVRITRNLY